MSIVKQNELWEYLSGLEKKAGGLRLDIKYAAVIELTLQGEPVIQFAGEELPSQKTYVRLKSYIPEKGDRVMLINNIITGGWRP